MFDVKEQKARILTSDKKLVDWLLSMNTNNRHARKTHVAWIEESVNKGEFILTGQGICVSKSGVLLDGQHRLQALVNAGYPSVKLLVVTGLDKKAQMYVDQHTKRTMADMLRLTLDKTISNCMASSVGFLMKLRHEDGMFRAGVKGRPSVQEFHDKMTECMKDLTTVVNATGEKVRVGAIVAIYDYHQRSPDKAIEFALQVRDGEMLKRDDAAYKLRQYLATHKGMGGTQSLETYRHTVSACIAHSQGRKMESLRPSNSWDELGKTQRQNKKKKKTT